MITHNGSRRLAYSLLILFLITVNLALPRPALAASGVVGTGTAASCTTAAFDTVYNAVETASGGTISFNCGTAPVTIIFAFEHQVSADLEIDGGDLVTLSGGNFTTLFQVFTDHTLTVSHLTLAHGYGDGGGVENFGTFNANDSQILNNHSINSGGGILNHNTLNVTNTLLANNSADKYGGGIFNDGGIIHIGHGTFTNNSAFSGGGAIAVDTLAVVLTASNSLFTSNTTTDTFAEGGAVYNDLGTLILDQDTFDRNFASRGGGVSLISGAAVITQSTFTLNYSAYGGGIRQEGGILTLTNVAFSGNGYTASGSEVNTGGGAASFYGGNATLTNVTMADNWASYGGGFDHDSAGATTLTNVTIVGNKAVGSAAFDQSAGTVVLVNVTINGNNAPFYGGVGNRMGTLTVKNTLLTNNTNTTTHNSENCYLPVVGNSFSLSSDATCGFGAGHDNQNLPLGPLAYNGGFTQTELLLKGSPAIDGGTGVGCPLTDQRGVTRPQGAACDVGAVEMTPGDLLLKAFLPLVKK